MCYLRGTNWIAMYYLQEILLESNQLIVILDKQFTYQYVQYVTCVL
jgi:hypothetical protein